MRDLIVWLSCPESTACINGGGPEEVGEGERVDDGSVVKRTNGREAGLLEEHVGHVETIGHGIHHEGVLAKLCRVV